MKTQPFPWLRLLSLATLYCALTLPVVSFTHHSSAAENTESAASAMKQTVQSVNINRADAERLAEVLKGVGSKKSQAIVKWREKNGNFKTVEQLMQVKGIGKKLLELNRSRIEL